MVEKIMCQAQVHKEPDGESKGCITCGGYGYVMERSSLCDGCGAKGWMRPGVTTVYIGKKITSVDGLTVEHTRNGRLCEKCNP